MVGPSLKPSRRAEKLLLSPLSSSFAESEDEEGKSNELARRPTAALKRRVHDMFLLLSLNVSRPKAGRGVTRCREPWPPENVSQARDLPEPARSNHSTTSDGRRYRPKSLSHREARPDPAVRVTGLVRVAFRSGKVRADPQPSGTVH